MACALPVVAASATGATSIIRDGETGILVEPDDIEGFADALESYARDPELRLRHGEAGLEIARTHDWDEVNSAVLKVYKGLLEHRRRS